MEITNNAFRNRATFAWAPRPRRPVDETRVNFYLFVNLWKVECSFGADTTLPQNCSK